MILESMRTYSFSISSLREVLASELASFGSLIWAENLANCRYIENSLDEICRHRTKDRIRPDS